MTSKKELLATALHNKYHDCSMIMLTKGSAAPPDPLTPSAYVPEGTCELQQPDSNDGSIM